MTQQNTYKGILTLPEEQYRASEAISKSDLDWIAPPRTPSHYRAKKDGLIASIATPAMKMGALVHRAVLEPDTMSEFVTRPEGLDFRSKEGKAWRDDNANKTILTHDEAATIASIVDSVWSHPVAKRIFKGAKTEQCLFAEDSEGMVRKARLDALVEGSIVPDLKTAACADAQEFEKSIGKFRYHVQAAYYLDICNLLGIEKRDFVFVVVEKEPPFAVAVYSLDEDAIRLGRMEYQRDLNMVRDCMESDEWPAFPHDIRVIGLPAYIRKQVEGLL
jgi:hypothetical protein